MRGWFLGVLCGMIPLFFAGCWTADFNPSETDRLRMSAGGKIILKSLEAQGFADWDDEGALLFSLYTRESQDEETTTKVAYQCDIRGDRVHSMETENASAIQRVYTNEGYSERRGEAPVQDPVVLVMGRRNTVRDYFFTALPFLLGRTPVVVEGIGSETLAGVHYDVVKIRSESGFFPVTFSNQYDLYFTHSTQRLEKVFFQARGNDLAGKYIWCEYENFARVDGVLIPHYREFTLAKDEGGEKEPKPFKTQWLLEVEFEGSVDGELFE